MSADCVPKLIGGDVELGNFIIGQNELPGKTDYLASRLLLSKVDGLPRRPVPTSGYWANGSGVSGLQSHGYDDGGGDIYGVRSQDWGRKYLDTNGGCIYIDLNHLELATPEVLSARDFQAVWAAMLRIAHTAQVAANEELAPDKRIVVLANNSDRQNNSYGGHCSFLMNRTTWDDMMRQRMVPALFYLMAYQVSSIVFTGQGKVGSENGQPAVPFQISQRADFIETLLSENTTFNRPLINTRDEPLCGLKNRHSEVMVPAERYARLHVIFYDTNLAPVATYLKVGVMQLILAMIEAEHVDHNLLLGEPLNALHEWSRDPDLKVHMPLLSGQMLTAVELQLKFLEQARAFEARYGFEGIVPGAKQIMELWQDTLLKLRSRAFVSLHGRIDWLMKRALCEQALVEHPDWGWGSPEITHLDQIYASIDPADSMFLSLYAAGLFEPVATEDEIVHFVSNPPENTRAWTRAMLLRAAGPARVAHVDWDKLEFTSASGRYLQRRRIQLPLPTGATRSACESLFSEAEDFSSLLDLLQANDIITDVQDHFSPGSAVSQLDNYRYGEYNQLQPGDSNE